MPIIFKSRVVNFYLYTYVLIRYKLLVGENYEIFGHSLFKHTKKTDAENKHENKHQIHIEDKAVNKKTRHPDDFQPTNKKTAGQTGSYQAQDTNHNHLHQMKRSISNASVKRRLKAAGLDRENFGRSLQHKLVVSY